MTREILRPERPGAAAAVVFFVALLVRLLFLLQPQPPLIPHADADNYRQAGLDLLAGRMSEMSWVMLTSRGPVYPAFLALFFGAFGQELGLVRGAQALLGALTAVFGWDIARRLAGPRAALIAGLLVALSPGLVLQTGEIHTETLATTLFWLAIALLLRGAGGGRLGIPIAAAVALGLATLTRPTLLPTVPFLVLAAAVGRAPRRQRLFAAGAFALALIAPILAWNVVAARRGSLPTAGLEGLKWTVSLARGGTDATLRGWELEDGEESRRTAVAASQPTWTYRTIAAANLVFAHLWFSDNSWRQKFLLNPTGMDHLQRVILLLGLGGVGIALIEWRRFAPLLAVLAGCALLSVKWIQLRHALPFLPALAILAGVLVDALWPERPYQDRRRTVLTLALAVSVATVAGVALLSSLGSASLGRIGDGVIILLAVAWGVVLFRIFRSRRSKGTAAVAAFRPAAVFILLFGAYVLVESVPRWRALRLELTDPGRPLVQEIHFEEPLVADSIKAATWLVDLETSDPPPVDVGLDGSWLPPEAAAWRPLSCAPRTPCRLQAVYEMRSAFAGRPLSGWPQWWRLPVDPTLVAGRPVVALSLRGRRGTPTPTVGAVVDDRKDGVFDGPSLVGRTSIYRWLVLEDFRPWEEIRLASRESRSRGVPGQDVRFNVRLWVRYNDGRQAFY